MAETKKPGHARLRENMDDDYYYYGTVGPATEDDSVCMPLLNGTHLTNGRIPEVLGIGTGILTVCLYHRYL